MVFCEGEGSVMNDGFGGLPQYCSLFLFETWVLDTPIKYVAALFGTIAMSILSEVMRVYRLRWDRDHEEGLTKDITLSIAYGIHMLNAYFLMLLIMLYDTCILVAIIVGLSAGHFLARRMNHYDQRRLYEVLPDAKAVNPALVGDPMAFESIAGQSPCCR